MFERLGNTISGAFSGFFTGGAKGALAGALTIGLGAGAILALSGIVIGIAGGAVLAWAAGLGAVGVAGGGLYGAFQGAVPGAGIGMIWGGAKGAGKETGSGPTQEQRVQIKKEIVQENMRHPVVFDNPDARTGHGERRQQEIMQGQGNLGMGSIG
jgi:hypothetical protein